MKSTELQQLTASEPLSLEEEYAMQKSWREDDNKCTFLILSKKFYEESQDEIESLIGDTNLFLQEDNDKLEEHNGDSLKRIAEAEIMIAEPNFRGKKLGWEAMLLMLKYGQHVLDINEYLVRINEENLKSIAMFTKMHFEEESRSNVFKEVTLRKTIDKNWVNWLDREVILDLQKYNSK